jgi:nicotinate-nucleotide--dimethylbenzimidazole phosphoribosyltransferase
MSPLPNFAEIRALADAMPPYEAAMRDNTHAALLRTTKSHDLAAFGIAAWVAAAQRRPVPHIDHVRCVVFAAAHGVALDLPGGCAVDIALEIDHMLDQDGEAAQTAREWACDLKLYDLAVERPTRDSRLMPAMTEAETATAASYGMMTVEPDVEAVSIAALGAMGDIAGASLIAALMPGAARAPSEYDARIDSALAAHRALSDPLALMAALGGPDIAAMLGAILAARLAGIPVILDGLAAHAAAAVASRLRSDAADHCRFATKKSKGLISLTGGLPLDGQLFWSVATPGAGMIALHTIRESASFVERRLLAEL